VCDRPEPQSEYQAKFSLQHCVAAALALPAVDFAAFDESARSALRSLQARVRLRAAEPYTSAYPRAWGSAVTVILADGSRLSAQRTQARGDPEAPLSRAEIIAKAGMLLQFGGVAEPDSLIAAVLALADDGPLPEVGVTV